jgi:hypothetical protein
MLSLVMGVPSIMGAVLTLVSAGAARTSVAGAATEVSVDAGTVESVAAAGADEPLDTEAVSLGATAEVVKGIVLSVADDGVVTGALESVGDGTAEESAGAEPEDPLGVGTEESVVGVAAAGAASAAGAGAPESLAGAAGAGAALASLGAGAPASCAKYRIGAA